MARQLAANALVALDIICWGRGRGRERLLALLAHFGVRPAGEAALLGRRQAEIRAAAQLLALGHVWHGLREATAAATESR